MPYDDTIEDFASRFSWDVTTYSDALPTKEKRLYPLSAAFDEVGKDGIIWQQGLPANTEENSLFFPTTARGLLYDPGKYWQWYKQETLAQQAIKGIQDTLLNGHYPLSYAPGEEPPNADEILAYLGDILDKEEKIFRSYIKDFTSSLISGFVIFEKVYAPDGTLKKLSLRRASSVYRWILSEDERALLAVEFQYDSGNVTIPAEKLIIYSYGSIGMDFEGISPLRGVGLLIDLKFQLLRLFGVSAEAYGTGILSVETTDEDAADTGDDAEILDVLSRSRGVDRPVLKLKYGHKLVLLSPTGSIPDFESMIRYLDEKILSAFRSQGSLLGFGQHGSYALAEDKRGESLATATALAGDLVCEVNSLIKEMIDLRFGEQDVYPRMTFRVAEEESSLDLAQIATAVQAGLVRATPEVVAAVHESLGLPVPEEEQASPLEGLLSDADFRSKVTPRTLTLSEDTSADFEKEISRIAKRVGKDLREVGNDYRKAFMELAGEATDPDTLTRLQDDLRPRYLDRMRGRITPHLIQAYGGGARGLLRSMVDTIAPGLIPDTATPYSKGVVDVISREALNLIESSTLAKAIGELDPNTRNSALAPIPSIDALTRRAEVWAMRTYNAGRERIIKDLKTRAETLGLDPRILAERSSVLERSTCDSCAALDGERAVVGSKRYADLSPPRKCEGEHRCRCIWTYILPDERGYRAMLESTRLDDYSHTDLLSTYIPYLV